ncbi:hypothetical protein HW555_005580 [Spodoptera exigua]|uniref:Uncharacterized protein n=1 Tax=Spodoptera exigua TaxID=7107 RepID=A0A835GKV7_SPOEX|nr:hypothetical protein HW555_005580 [Spodoptera exigua]
MKSRSTTPRPQAACYPTNREVHPTSLVPHGAHSRATNIFDWKPLHEEILPGKLPPSAVSPLSF